MNRKLKELLNKLAKQQEERSNFITRAAEEDVEIAELKEIRSNIENKNTEIKETEESIKEIRSLIEESKKDIGAGVKTKTPETKEERDLINGYLHKDLKLRDITNGVKVEDAAVTIPKSIVYSPDSEVKTVTDLARFVRHFQATTGSGTYPILKRATAKMHTVAELAKNPDLAKPEFISVDWKIDTCRAAIPVSRESIDDSAVDLVGIVSQSALEQKINTTNDAIATELKSFTAKEVDFASVDDLKKIINVDLDVAYNKSMVVSQSFYQELDTIKDKNGRYLLHDAITSGSPATLLGMPVYVIEDELFGAKGEAHAFIGDLQRAVVMADRSDIQVRWFAHEYYGEYLQAAIRFDVVKADDKAGFFLSKKA